MALKLFLGTIHMQLNISVLDKQYGLLRSLCGGGKGEAGGTPVYWGEWTGAPQSILIYRDLNE